MVRVSVSRAVKPLVDDVRPADYFSQKNCALQYSAMLDKAGTPKRKRTSDGAPEVGEIIKYHSSFDREKVNCFVLIFS